MRLIDADALMREMHNVILEDGEDRRIFYSVIERQPTIIPSDEPTIGEIVERTIKGKGLMTDNEEGKTMYHLVSTAVIHKTPVNKKLYPADILYRIKNGCSSAREKFIFVVVREWGKFGTIQSMKVSLDKIPKMYFHTDFKGESDGYYNYVYIGVLLLEDNCPICYYDEKPIRIRKVEDHVEEENRLETEQANDAYGRATENVFPCGGEGEPATAETGGA